MERWEEYEGATPRAPRFPLAFPLRYRDGEDMAWREGHGTNISRSGVLFRVERPVRLRAPVEFSFVLPVQMRGKTAATVVCQGHVVRQASGQGRGDLVVAASIETYRFERDPSVHG
jgi:hypothetical protein